MMATTPKRQRTVPARLMAWRPDAYAYIARALRPPVSRQHVRFVAWGARVSPRVMAEIQATLAKHGY